MKVKCQECEWEGNEEDLIMRTDHMNMSDSYHCPKCGSYEMEEIK
jgi:NAD-dependent SIR2 family protein deacetylase